MKNNSPLRDVNLTFDEKKVSKYPNVTLTPELNSMLHHLTIREKDLFKCHTKNQKFYMQRSRQKYKSPVSLKSNDRLRPLSKEKMMINIDNFARRKMKKLANKSRVKNADLSYDLKGKKYSLGSSDLFQDPMKTYISRELPEYQMSVKSKEKWSSPFISFKKNINVFRLKISRPMEITSKMSKKAVFEPRDVLKPVDYTGVKMVNQAAGMTSKESTSQ